MEWTSQSEKISEGVVRTRILRDGRCLSHEQVHDLWKTNSEFSQFYSSAILAAGFDSFCWETPAITNSNLADEHEFVVVDSPLLETKRANAQPFQEHFDSAFANVISFPNLGRNGIMIVPVPMPNMNFNHLANFLKSAPDDVIAEIWQLAGQEIGVAVGVEPKWLSTAGLGVSWLHLRIDSKPKYYRYAPYRGVV